MIGRRAAAATAALCVAIACSARGRRGAPASSAQLPALFAATTIAQQQYYPRIARIDTVDDATTAWLRDALARYYPTVLTTDRSLAFVSLYLSAEGRIVGAAARSRADVGADTADQNSLATFIGSVDTPARDSAHAAADRANFKADLDTMFASQNPTRSVLGTRIVLPRQFAYDPSRRVSPNDPFLGADAHAFERDDDIYLKAGMVGPNGVHVHVLTLLPGRGGPADFGHQVLLRKPPQTSAAPASPQPDIEHLGDLPGGGWAVTPELWATLTHKPVILIDGLVRSFDDMIALSGHADSIVDFRRLPPAAAMRLTRDSAAAYGALVVTTKGHRAPRGGAGQR